jgi:hypothetical protein
VAKANADNAKPKINLIRVYYKFKSDPSGAIQEGFFYYVSGYVISAEKLFVTTKWLNMNSLE